MEKTNITEVLEKYVEELISLLKTQLLSLCLLP